MEFTMSEQTEASLTPYKDPPKIKSYDYVLYCNMADMTASQRIVRKLEKDIWESVPSVQDLFQSYCGN